MQTPLCISCELRTSAVDVVPGFQPAVDVAPGTPAPVDVELAVPADVVPAVPVDVVHGTPLAAAAASENWRSVLLPVLALGHRTTAPGIDTAR
jgi:hypothetical protein